MAGYGKANACVSAVTVDVAVTVTDMTSLDSLSFLIYNYKQGVEASLILSLPTGWL